MSNSYYKKDLRWQREKISIYDTEKIINIIGSKLKKTVDRCSFKCHIIYSIKKDNTTLINIKNKYDSFEKEIATISLISGKQTKLKPILYDIELYKE